MFNANYADPVRIQYGGSMKPENAKGLMAQPDVAAVMYGIGARFDHQPELLFRLRAVDELELIVNAGKAAPLEKKGAAAGRVLGGEDLSDMFGLDMAQSAELVEEKPGEPKRAVKVAAVKKKPRKGVAVKRGKARRPPKA